MLNFCENISFIFRCGCGRNVSAHSQQALSRFSILITKQPSTNFLKKWTIKDHTVALPTDAYGVIEFQVF